MRDLSLAEVRIVAGGIATSGGVDPLINSRFELSSYDSWITAGYSPSWGAAATPDYCGTENSAWVPDSPFGYEFAQACSNHDQNLNAGMPKAQADAVFYAQLREVCAAESGLSYIGCEIVAGIYYVGVSLFGPGPVQ